MMRIPIVRASIPYLGVSFGVAFLGWWGWRQTGYQAFAFVSLIAVALFASLVYFFRDPERARPYDPNLVLSPADGRVRKIHRTAGSQEVEIFLAVWNVHVQRAPVSGKVMSQRFTKGTYFAAYDDRSGTRNTRCATRFVSPRGRVRMLQVAGILARKVECWVRPGDRVRQGQRVGLIHLGSQVRVKLPRRTRVLIKLGSLVHGGLTPIAKWR